MLQAKSALKLLLGAAAGLGIGVGVAGLFMLFLGISPPPPVVPTAEPSEEYRLSAGAAFSIVGPRSWHSSATSSMIECASALPSSTSYPLGRIIAHESFPGDNVPEPGESEEEIVFRGRPASLITRQDPPRKFLGPPYFVYSGF